MSNESSETLKVNYTKRNQPRYTDVQTIDVEKSARQKAKKDQLDHLYNENYQPAKYSKALEYKNTRSYKKKLPNGQYVLFWPDSEITRYIGRHRSPKVLRTRIILFYWVHATIGMADVCAELVIMCACVHKRKE